MTYLNLPTTQHRQSGGFAHSSPAVDTKTSTPAQAAETNREGETTSLRPNDQAAAWQSIDREGRDDVN